MGKIIERMIYALVSRSSCSIAVSRAIMREEFKRDPGFKTIYKMNIEMWLYATDPDGHHDRVENGIAEMILDNLFQK